MKRISKFSIFSLLLLLNIHYISCFDLNFNDLYNYMNYESSLLNRLDEYIISEEQRISRLRQIHTKLSKDNSIAVKNKELVLKHPFDVYLLIKRIAVEWKTVDDLLEPNKQILRNYWLQRENENLININSTGIKLSDAVEGFENLIYFYQMDINSAANGLIKTRINSPESIQFRSRLKVDFKSLSNQIFDANDCYLMGKQSFKNEDYVITMEWLELALNRTDNQTSDAITAGIVKHLFMSEYHLKNYNKSFEILNQNIDLFTQYDDIYKMLLDQLEIIQSNDSNYYITEKESRIKLDTEEAIRENPNKHFRDNITQDVIDKSDYLCLGINFMNISVKSKLKCFYLNTTFKPYLRLMRIKIEELFKRPQIVLIRNFLTETEIQTIQDLSGPTLQRMAVFDEGNNAYYNKNRIAQGAYLYQNQTNNKLLDNVINRITAITGLNATDSTGSSDPMNVIKYFVGGHYTVHHDSDHTYKYWLDNRIATWINYLSDVDAGGATTFPNINVTVWPQKSDAIFWYNLYKSGQIDMDTVHSGCPILYGNKWITTKWIRTLRQSNHYKCTEDLNDRYYLQEFIE